VDGSYEPEKKTRKDRIDPELRKRVWLDKYVKEEVNSVKSNFRTGNFVLFEGSVEKNVDHFIDYLLIDEDNTVLALIEAKRFSKNEEKGRIQARTYSKDIEKQTKEKVPIFLTNGLKWRFMDEEGVERDVSGPFSQEDLRRRKRLFNDKKDIASIPIDTKIVDRPRSLRVVRELSEHFSQGHRKALVLMATGTGKTRVAMALIKLLIDANVVRNVLFVADRISLANQAKSKGFKEFFSEPVSDLREGFTTTGRLYVTTIQTLMGGEPGLYSNFSPGFFDLIIFDEAHRSIYDKGNLINKYFDAIKIGLTATPRECESQNTYELFDCGNGKPTVEYPYEEAVNDRVLVRYKSDIIDTDVLSRGIRGKELSKRLRDDLRRQEEDPDIELSGSEYARAFMDDKTNELIIRDYMDHCYKSDEGMPAKTIFFCAGVPHSNCLKGVFDRVFPKLGNEVQVINSDMDRAEDEVHRFQLDSEPRIALSVGMLDTGIDVPEVCNLVFVKPVYSKIRFWQMVGRGTRNQASCKHLEWLPKKTKNDFLIFDYKIGGHSNILFHEFEASEERQPQKDVITKIFENRVDLLKKSLTNEQKKIISDKIMYDVDSIDTECFIAREKSDAIERVKEHPAQLDKYIEDLEKDIAPLMILSPGENANVSSFILRVEKLFRFVLNRNYDQIDLIRQYAQEMAENVLRKDNLTEIRNNRDKLIKVLQEDFWDDLTWEDVDWITKEIAPLMKYYELDPKRIIQIDAPDIVLKRESFEKEIKQDPKLHEFLEKSPLIKKIKDGTGVTPEELLEIESHLTKIKPEVTIDNIQKYQKVDFLKFLREIIGLTSQYDPSELIAREFDNYVILNNNYNSKQLEFLELLKKYFIKRKHLEVKDLSKPPLSNEGPLDKFSMTQLQEIVHKCKTIKMK
jgi:type I restriction enzyme R subunit